MKPILFLTGALGLLGWAYQALGQTPPPAMPYPPPGAERPLPFPAVTKYEPEKTGKTDPVADASRGMIAWFTVTTRPTPAPFVRVTVPDPFENRNLLRVPNPVPEEPAPPLLLPKK